MGDGLKLMEQGCSGFGGTLTGLALLISPAGPWHGKRLAVVGDYAKVGDLPAGLPYADNPLALYEAMTSEQDGQPFTDNVKRVVSEAFGITYSGRRAWLDREGGESLEQQAASVEPDPNWGPLYVVNLDKGQVLDPHVFGAGRNLPAMALLANSVMLATTLLLAVSNGRGGGDFHCDDDPDENLVGSWGGDRVVILPLDHLGSLEDISERMRALIERCDHYAAQDMPARVGELSPPQRALDGKAPKALRPDMIVGPGGFTTETPIS
jgi:hypothetical protein